MSTVILLSMTESRQYHKQPVILLCPNKEMVHFCTLGLNHPQHTSLKPCIQLPLIVNSLGVLAAFCTK